MGAGDATEPFGTGQQQAIVRTDHVVAAGRFQGNRSTRSADAGVDHGHMGADGQERHSAPQHQRAVADVVFLHLVGDVDHECLGSDAKDHTAADGRRGVAHAPVGEDAHEGPVPFARNARGGGRGDDAGETACHECPMLRKQRAARAGTAWPVALRAAFPLSSRRMSRDRGGAKWDRAARYLKIVSILNEHRDGISAQKIADLIGVSKRTIYRDLEAMQLDADLPIWGEGGLVGVDRRRVPAAAGADLARGDFAVPGGKDAGQDDRRAGQRADRRTGQAGRGPARCLARVHHPDHGRLRDDAAQRAVHACFPGVGRGMGEPAGC